MRVAVDARRLQDQTLTGVGRWIGNLLPQLARQVEVVLLTDKSRPSPGLESYDEVGLARLAGLPEPVWLQGSAARWLRGFSGVFHGTYNAVPFGYGGPSVVSMYDLSWEHHPEDFSRATRWSMATQARWSARHAGAVVTCSEFSRQSIVETYGVAAERVFVAHPAIDPIFTANGTAEDRAALLARLGVSGPYIAAMGGAKRRGLEVAVAAWQRLGVGRPTLVVLGAEVPPPLPGLVHVGRLSDQDWPLVLSGATAFCYPTRYEGYGMPALEAAASGVPVVCARIGPLPEVLGEAAQWCDEPTVTSIADGLAALLGDAGRLAALRQAGLARVAAAPSWAEGAAQVLAAYEVATA
ncbi:MAG TPA: glycosyltransferase family 1 protein [Acidimicrobiales bacterium]|jgi:glycosyltransferase involved in cell wall biosynthesis|nr:glycosyltransferase family 1 protein [Acidimicrobiales bacterium]